MKEATGELNLTVVVVIAVGLLIAFFYFTVWPHLDANFEANSKCSKAICENPCKKSENVCPDALDKLAKCHVKGSDNIIYCPWKG